MNFKRNCLLITSLLASVFMIASCGASNQFVQYEYFDAAKDNHEDESFDDGKYVKYGNYSNYVAYGDKDMGNVTNVMRKYGDKKLLNTTGEEKLLVIPVEFKDFKCEDLSITRETFIDNVNKSFNGVSENNSYVSVAEYFNRSSYGKLKLRAKVVNEFCTLSKSAEEIKNLNPESLTTFYSEVVKWYESKYNDINDYVIKGMESDKDPAEAHNVAIFLVYTYPIPVEEETEKVTSKVFWAYTFQTASMCWASYSFLYAQSGEPNAHTYIHEVGHLLGLMDYYPKVETRTVSAALEPTARIDMMDCSIGDESSFSKMYLDWVRPYHVKQNCEITISSFEKSGDCILLSDNWNGSVFDEYYLVEFYTPTGLNAFDCMVGNSEAKLPTLPGVKVYHVDARLGYFNNRNHKEFSCYCDAALPTTGNDAVDFAHNNSTYESPKQNELNYLYRLILNDAKEGISGCAQNYHLFRQGSTVPALELSNGTTLNYKISVSSLNYKEAKIKIEKISN